MDRQASSKPDSGSPSTANIGKTVGEGMVAIEHNRTRLKGMLPKGYASLALAKSRTGFQPVPPGDNELKTRSTSHRSADLLGHVYDWSGARQAAKGSPQGERGGVHQFYTPSCFVRCLVEMHAPYTALRGCAFLQREASSQVVSAAKDKGRIYDPACGSDGMFVQSIKFVEANGGPGQRDSASPQSEATLPSLSAAKGNWTNISIYGQDKWERQQPKPNNATTSRHAVMNLALRGIEADFGPEHADTFRRDFHPDLRADYSIITGKAYG
jgi:type I restriction enzyme M protein